MEEVETRPRKRPALVWVIFIFYVISFVLTLVYFYLIYGGGITIPPEMESKIVHLSTLDKVLSAIGIIITTTAAISLFLLKRVALYLFLGGLLLGIFNTIRSLANEDLMAKAGSGIISIFIGIGISAAICYYAWKLTKSGVLS